MGESVRLPSNVLITREVRGPHFWALEIIYRPSHTDGDYWGVLKMTGQEVERLFGPMVGIGTPEADARARGSLAFEWRVTTNQDLQEIAQAWDDSQAIEALLKSFEMGHPRLSVDDRRRMERIFGQKLAGAAASA